MFGTESSDLTPDMQHEIDNLRKEIEQAVAPTPRKIDAMNRLSALLSESEQTESQQLLQQAIEQARKINYAPGQAQALLQAGMSAASLRNFAEAENFYRQALQIRQTINDMEGQAAVLAKLGNVLVHQARYSEALEQYDAAIAVRRNLKDELAEADLYSNSAVIYGIQGNYSLALTNHLHALKTYERLHEPARIASACSNIGLLYKDQHNFDEALRMFNRALIIREETNDTKTVSDLLNNIGNVYHEQNKFDEALYTHQRALKLRELSGEKAKIASSYSNLGNIYRATKQSGIALDYYLKSLALFSEVDERRGLVQSYNNLAELYFEQGNFPEAHAYIKAAIELGEKLGWKSQNRVAYQLLASMWAAEHNYEEAYKAHLHYSQLDKEISNTETSRQIAQMTMRYEIEQKERDAEAERIKNAELTKAYNALDAEKKRSEELLNNILPEEISEELKQSGKTRARHFPSVTVLFCDIKGFTKISEQLTAEELVSGLDEYFEAFDRIVDRMGVEKIKTIGDAYLCAGGIPVAMEDHAQVIVQTAIEFTRSVNLINSSRSAKNKACFEFRFGINTGPVVAGVVGIKKFVFDIWGDTVNTASRMQQNCDPGKINISDSTYQLIKDSVPCLYRGEVEAKNKGKLKMYYVEANSDAKD